MIEIALVGNPNCGKTTLFNKLTQTYQRTGNWTGVTNEKKVGEYAKDKSITIVDLPGLYSLRAKSPDERVSVSNLVNCSSNVIINVIDATNLERSLYLTCELTTLETPMVIALNMCDKLEDLGLSIDEKTIENAFGVPVVKVSALKKLNIDKLIKIAKESQKTPKLIRLDKYKRESLIEKRYAFIEELISDCVIKKRIRLRNFGQNLDNLLMSNKWGIPIFFVVMTAVYCLSIKLGGVFGDLITVFFERLSNSVVTSLIEFKTQVWVVSFINAIIGALSGVLSFLPQILILFSLLAVIEDSGYASRATFLFDRFFRSFGLGGKSLMPMIVGCGCTVTGLMSTRIVDGVNERRMTIFLSPFMPCGAKTAVFAWFSHAFFNGNPLIATSMYFISILSVGIFGKILKKLKYFKDVNNGFIMEIPSLKLPSIINVFEVMKEKVKEFLTKAGLTVFVVSVFIWLLKSVGRTGYVGENIENSFLYDIGNLIKWIFYPLGFGSWQASVAVISGTFAKEAIIETLELICMDVGSIFYSKFSAYAFMTFVLLSPPCIASLVTARRELGSFKWFLFMCAFQFISAYLVALLINILGFLILSCQNLLLSVIVVIITIAGVIFAIKTLRKSGCKGCTLNCKGDNKCHKRVKRFTI